MIQMNSGSYREINSNYKTGLLHGVVPRMFSIRFRCGNVKAYLIQSIVSNK